MSVSLNKVDPINFLFVTRQVRMVLQTITYHRYWHITYTESLYFPSTGRVNHEECFRARSIEGDWIRTMSRAEVDSSFLCLAWCHLLLFLDNYNSIANARNVSSLHRSALIPTIVFPGYSLTIVAAQIKMRCILQAPSSESRKPLPVVKSTSHSRSKALIRS